ncbi:MAG: hypothetical protein LT105_09310 [Lentimicrobium sp.]|nr:hypothetical protein [Lentimicrobium sp.]
MRLFLRSGFLTFASVAIAALFSGCDNNDPDLVPAYISVDKIDFTAQYEQGTSSHKLTDVWVYLDETLLGAYELPAKFPVLAEGKQNITFRPGFRINGIAATRAIYPFATTVTRELNLTRDSVTHIASVASTYKNNVLFPWIERFESGTLSIERTQRSHVNIQRTDDPALAFSYPGEGTGFSGLIEIESDTAIFEAVTRETFDFPRAGSEVFLEINFKTNNPVTVGVFYKSSGIEVQRPMLVLNKSENWNKIYVNLTTPKYDTPNATDFRIFFGAKLESGNEKATILIDNLKLVHFNTSK